MPLEIVTVPCLGDNYAFLAHDAASGQTALVDVPEAAPVLAELAARGWRLSHVLLTHHHWDHVQGLEEVLARHPATVVGNAADAHRLPALDLALTPGGTVTVGGEAGTMIDVGGHTLGHVAYHFADSRVVFTGDSLMALGCGRVFEGTPQQMWDSLSRLAALPDDTTVCSGHEYTLANGKFAATIEPENPDLVARIRDTEAARAEGRPTVPSLLALEKATNPFLRTAVPDVQRNVGMEGAAPAEVFAEIRSRKDNF